MLITFPFSVTEVSKTFPVWYCDEPGRNYSCPLLRPLQILLHHALRSMVYTLELKLLVLHAQYLFKLAASGTSLTFLLKTPSSWLSEPCASLRSSQQYGSFESQFRRVPSLPTVAALLQLAAARFSENETIAASNTYRPHACITAGARGISPPRLRCRHTGRIKQ